MTAPAQSSRSPGRRASGAAPYARGVAGRSCRLGTPTAAAGAPRLGLVAALCAVSAIAGPLAAQEGCEFVAPGNDVVFSETLPGIGRVTYVTRPHFLCEGGVEIWADSAVAYDDRRMSDLFGSVRYDEAVRSLRANNARYFSDQGRLQASGDVVLVDEARGSSIENGDLVYLLETDFRDEAEITVTTAVDGKRPRAVLAPPAQPDSAATAGAAAHGPSPEPYTVIGDRIFLRGASYFAASGDVEIVRDSLVAFADSAEYVEDGGALTLEGSARIEGESYELTGRTITMTDPVGPESEVEALREARLTGENLRLRAARIVVGLRDEALEWLVGTPLAAPGTADADSVDLERPEAVLEEYELTADSLEVTAPGERLRRVFASGSARSVSTARDSLNAEVLPELARRDWLEGDTVIIRFAGADPVPPITAVPADSLAPLPDSVVPLPDSLVPLPDSVVPLPDSVVPLPDSMVGVTDSMVGTTDSAAVLPDPLAVAVVDSADDTPPVEEIIARIRARSLYRLSPSDSTFRAGADAPAVHYVVGREIRILLDSGEVAEMQVTGQTRGVHLEPLRRRTEGDSIGSPPDTAGAAVDTSGVAAPDTASVRVDTTLAEAAANDSLRKAYQSQPKDPPTDRSRGPRRDQSGLPEDHPWIRR